jgi:hypothetical protein
MSPVAFHSGISAVHGNQHCFTVYQAWIADDSIDSVCIQTSGREK